MADFNCFYSVPETCYGGENALKHNFHRFLYPFPLFSACFAPVVFHGFFVLVWIILGNLSHNGKAADAGLAASY